jgi:DNA-binding GntR family transcriptional regulator
MPKTPTSPQASPRARTTGSIGTSLGEQAYVAIKRMILTGELRAGEQLNVAMLAEKLELGRSPVHMAMHRLDREGLIAIIPRKGILVKAETMESFLELIAARQLVEPHLTGEAMNHMTPDLLAQLDLLVEQGWKHHRESDRLGGMQVDRLFHQTLYDASGNSILSAFAGQLLDRSMVLWFRAPKGDEKRPNVAELESLLAAIKENDRVAAMALMSEHIASVQEKYFR